jgi:hypothetical protein
LGRGEESLGSEKESQGGGEKTFRILNKKKSKASSLNV